MATFSEPSRRDEVRNFHSLFRQAKRQVIDGPGNVRELRIELDVELLSARSRLLSLGGLLFVLGENRANEDLTLRHEGSQAMVAVHAPLRGSAVPTMDGLGSALTGRTGELQLFASPTSHSTVRLRAKEKNQAFRVALTPASIAALASRHAELEPLAAHVAGGTPYCGKPIRALPIHRVLDEATEIMNSEHYGALRPLFLESRALSWLALALATRDERATKAPAPREVDRMHDARDLLLSRLADPPSLAEVASAVGTNDFALKRNFKAVFGQPVYAYLLALRLSEARRLLLYTRDTVKEIAAAVGYSHPNHFSTAFRRSFGVSPAEYRNGAGR
jgi:AraC-like DNA-binding protein